ncbi:Glycosyl transferases group 1 [Raineyella antarctica]|uniref:Glycosyl transferases group 1 n=1 Tax=Raineyella antarctica TaxID=1577474 RepID=A0A1G6HH04_9ACTN|nr:glycosyltransferase [Raineyella antarctica]SDB93454.1 Glycosyl transferases group 1 [Raineyella antarctica]
MRILICPHQMGMGGSQLNAVELASAIREYGHEPLVYSPPGVLTEIVRDAGLTWIEAPPPDSPGLAWSRRLANVVRLWDVQLLHVYEWRTCLQAAFGSGRRVPMLMSVMSMEVPSFLPTHLPIVVGTPQLQQRMLAQGRTAHLLEPPVDMDRFHTVDASSARAGWGISEDELVIGVVSMLTTDLEKLQGVLEAIRVVDRLSADHPLRLLIAGDGEGRAAVEARAQAVNARHGRTVIQPLGFQLDSAPVYSAADIVLGMGSSAIKGMAHAKPLVVHGEAGFWKVLDETTAHDFLHAGWYGHGGDGARDLVTALTRLVESPALRHRLGAYGRNLVIDRYDASRAAAHLATIYSDTVLDRCPRTTQMRSLTRSAMTGARYYAAMRMGSVVAREEWARQGAYA